MMIGLWVAAALAAGWRGDGTGRAPGPGPSFFVSPVWTAAAPATGNATPVLVGDRVCATAEPTTLWCVDAASGRSLWSRSNEWLDTVPAAERPAAQERLAAGERALTELATTQTEYSRLQREARRSAADPAVFTQLEQLAGKMDTLRRAADAIADYRTPSDRSLIGWSSPTPVSDGRSIWALFGHGVVSRFDLAGNRQWSVWLGAVRHEMRGYDKGSTASPSLVGDTLVVPYNGLRGLDAATGAERWAVGQWRDYGSPAVGTVGGVGVVLTPDGSVISAADGRVFAQGLGDVWYTSPILDGDVALWVGGTQDAHVSASGGARATAVRLSASGGAVRATPLWSVVLPVAERFYAAPVVHDGVLYAVSKDGTIVALRTSDGAQLYLYSLADQLDGEPWANLMVSAGVLYLATDVGEVLAVRAGPTYEPLGISRVGPMLAAPAFGLGRVYFRTYKGIVAYGG